MSDSKFEYDPEEIPIIEPDEDPEYEPEDIPAAPTTLSAGAPAANGYGEREFEYRTEALSLEQVLDGKTLGERLTTASADGWQLVDIVDAGDRRVLVLRKQKKAERVRRSVGFAPPTRS
ncbi:MAG: hypothetical protein E6J29_02900 [Chloroflexi bacterium]|nr:MAG: hypothetical protein E6J29_02900 [Chloroflexota bacterium]TMD51963.1 MAG: hypothetical protein E6I85_11785 [Chloroflexota bacterium]